MSDWYQYFSFDSYRATYSVYLLSYDHLRKEMFICWCLLSGKLVNDLHRVHTRAAEVDRVWSNYLKCMQGFTTAAVSQKDNPLYHGSPAKSAKLILNL